MALRKMIAILTAVLMPLTFLPAFAKDVPTVALGDGAPIPYLEGYTSRLIRDSAMMPGITGQADLSWQQSESRGAAGQSPVQINVQNLALTDDALAIFYRAEYPEFLPLSYGHSQLSYDEAVPFLNPCLNGVPLPVVSCWREGRPEGDRALMCLALYSLETPVPDQSLLSFETDGTDKAGPVSLASCRIDRSRAKDPTVSYSPDFPVNLNYERYPRQKTVFELTVQRVSFGPFGNRLQYLIRDRGRDSGILNCLLEDGQGNALPIRSMSNTFSTLGSPVKPVDMPNEIWFYAGEDTDALRIVPVKILSQTAPTLPFKTLPLDSDFPVTLPLANGSAVTLSAVALDENGFRVDYSANDIQCVFFEPGDSRGQPLDLFYLSSTSFDLPSQSFQMQGLWMAGYRGQPVSRVSDQQIGEFTTLRIASFAQDHEIPLPELAVRVPLK